MSVSESTRQLGRQMFRDVLTLATDEDLAVFVSALLSKLKRSDASAAFAYRLDDTLNADPEHPLPAFIHAVNGFLDQIKSCTDRDALSDMLTVAREILESRGYVVEVVDKPGPLAGKGAS